MDKEPELGGPHHSVLGYTAWIDKLVNEGDNSVQLKLKFISGGKVALPTGVHVYTFSRLHEFDANTFHKHS